MGGRGGTSGARMLAIEAKLRTSAIAVASPADFRFGDSRAADPALVLTQANLSLYCLDLRHRQALFVETPEGVDVAGGPFLYQAQYDAARSVLRVPFEALQRLADQVRIEPSRIVLVYSVGRCGSTLVSQALGAVNGVQSLSEADAFTQLRDHWVERGFEGKDKERLLRACLMLQCVPGLRAGASAWAFKFRSLAADMAGLFHAVVPEARIVFLYRHAAPWARSFLRFLRVASSEEAVARLDWLAGMWLTVMDQCRDMQRQGVPMFLARYEELASDPRAVLAAMLEWCGLPPMEPDRMVSILGRDSQAGSAIARERLGELPFDFSPDLADRLDRLIRHYSPGLSAGAILPGTYRPPR